MGNRRVKVSLSEIVKVSGEEEKRELDRSETFASAEDGDGRGSLRGKHHRPDRRRSPSGRRQVHRSGPRSRVGESPDHSWDRFGQVAKCRRQIPPGTPEGQEPCPRGSDERGRWRHLRRAVIAMSRDSAVIGSLVTGSDRQIKNPLKHPASEIRVLRPI